MSRECLKFTEYEKFKDILIKNGYEFTSSMEFRVSAPISQRAIDNIANTYINDINKIGSRFFAVFTDITIRFRQDDKHSIGLFLSYNGDNNYILEYFDSNGDRYMNQRVLGYLREITNKINKSSKLPYKVLLKSVNSVTLNTEGTGHCAAWTYYYYYKRPELGIYENAKKNIERWDPKYIFQINNFIRDINASKKF